MYLFLYFNILYLCTMSLNKIKYYLLSSIIFININNVNAQLTSGLIEYNLHFIELPAEVEAYKDMLPITQEIFFKDSILKENIFSLYGLKQTKFVNYYTGNINLFVDYNNHKASVLLPINQQNALTIIYNNDTTAFYKGFTVKKANITFNDGYSFDIWYTTEIPSYYSNEFNGLKGFPIIFESSLEGLRVVYTFNKIEYKNLPTGFMDNPIGYQPMSLEEFYNSLQSTN